MEISCKVLRDKDLGLVRRGRLAVTPYVPTTYDTLIQLKFELDIGMNGAEYFEIILELLMSGLVLCR